MVVGSQPSVARPGPRRGARDARAGGRSGVRDVRVGTGRVERSRTDLRLRNAASSSPTFEALDKDENFNMVCIVMKAATAAPARDAPGRAGRPRDARLDAAIEAAAFELIAEAGYNGLSIKAVAERAGTTTPAVYRRWSSKAELVLSAV